jgi:hypothetical protein
MLEHFELDSIDAHEGECTATSREHFRSDQAELLQDLGITTKPETMQQNFVRFLLTFRASNRNILRSCIAHARCWAFGLGPLNDRDPFKGSSKVLYKEAYTMATKKKATKKAAKKKKH